MSREQHGRTKGNFWDGDWFIYVGSQLNKDDDAANCRNNTKHKKDDNNRTITKVRVAEGVEEIADKAFKACRHLKCVEIPHYVRRIGEYAFSGCYALEEITFSSTSESTMSCGQVSPPSRLKEIGCAAFEFCRSLRIVHLPDSVQYLGSRAFSDCAGLTDVILPNWPAGEGEEQPFQEIEEFAFRFCKRLKSIKLPNSIKRINRHAFFECDELERVVMPDTVEEFGMRSFAKCSKLNSFHIFADSSPPNKESEIMDDAADSTTTTAEIKTCKLPTSIKRIQQGAFFKCTSLLCVEIPDTIEEIGEEAFAHCSSMQGTLTIPNSLQEIPRHTFQRCSGLQKVIFPNSLLRINTEAFSECSGLQSITFPNSLQSIEEKAFYTCRGIRGTVIFPDSIQQIGRLAFYGCDRLEHVTFAPPLPPQERNGYSRIRNVGVRTFMGCSALKTVELPNSIWRIKMFAFANCTALTSVSLPTRLQSIDEGAFSHCFELQNIINKRSDDGNRLPLSLENVGTRAFKNCSKLPNEFNTDSIHYWCDLGRGGRRFLMRGDDDYIIMIDADTNHRARRKEYPSGLWPLILNRVLHKLELPVYTICQRDYDYAAAGETIRRSSVIYYLMVHGVAMDYR